MTLSFYFIYNYYAMSVFEKLFVDYLIYTYEYLTIIDDNRQFKI